MCELPIVKTSLAELNQLLFSDHIRDAKKDDPFSQNIYVIENFFSDNEVETILGYTISVFSTSLNFNFRGLTSKSFHTLRDLRPPLQKAKGISQNLFIGPQASSIPDEILKLYRKAALLRYSCLRPDLSCQINPEQPFAQVPELGHPIFDIRQYPSSHGHLDEHVDPPSNQGFVGMIFLKGFTCSSTSTGLYFRLAGHYFYLDQFLSPGDAYIFDPSIPHGVHAIGKTDYSHEAVETLDVNWDSSNGRWAAFCPWLTPS